MNEELKNKIIEEYFENNGKKIYGVVKSILKKFGGIYQKDYDDFYSIANEVFTKIIDRYDGKNNFEAFLYSCLRKKIMTEITKRNSLKRKPDREAVSFDKLIGESQNSSIENLTPSDFDIDTEIENKNILYNEKIKKYFLSLSEMQRKILRLKMEGYASSEIKEILNITEKQYSNYVSGFRSYEKMKNLYRDTEITDTKKPIMPKEEFTMRTNRHLTAAEKQKTENPTISMICRDLKRQALRDNHVLQRASGQWNALDKSELISDILQGKIIFPIVVSYEKKGNSLIKWLIDGKQRCTTIDEFLNDGFAVSRKVHRHNIEYQTAEKDENGNYILDNDGNIIYDFHTFDIRRKKFSELPKELQEQFTDYQITTLVNLNSTPEEIAYDTARFNRSRRMNTAQEGWTGLDEDYAEILNRTLRDDFFKEGCSKSAYKESSSKTGALRRMAVESIMLADFTEDFDKDFKKMCFYLSENAYNANFTNFCALVERIKNILNDETAELFNIKESFLWFALFSKFRKTGLQDRDFADFLIQFKRNLHSKKINGVSFDDLREKTIKSKANVSLKIMHLENLMCEFLHIQKEENPANKFNLSNPYLLRFINDFSNCDIVKDDGDSTDTVKSAVNEETVRNAVKSLIIVSDDNNLSEKDLSDSTIQKYIADFEVDNKATESVLFYASMLNGFTERIDQRSKLLNKEHIPELVGITKYSDKKSIDDKTFEDWLEHFSNNFEKNRKLGLNSVENLNYMISDLNDFSVCENRKELIAV